MTSTLIQTVLAIITAAITLVGSLIAAGAAAIRLIRELIELTQESNERRMPSSQKDQEQIIKVGESRKNSARRLILQEMRDLIQKFGNRRSEPGMVLIKEGPSVSSNKSESSRLANTMDSDELEISVSRPSANSINSKTYHTLVATINGRRNSQES